MAEPKKTKAEAEHDAAPPQDPPKQDSELSAAERKSQKEAQLEASQGADKALSPEEANPVKGAHLEAIEGAVDLSKYPGEALSVEEKLEASFEAGEDVKQ